MNIYALMSLNSALLSLFLGSFVFALNRKELLNKMFYFFCITLFFWAFAQFMRLQANDYKTACLWTKLNFLWPFVIASLMHMVLVFTEKNKIIRKKLTLVLIYLPAAVVSVTHLLSDLWTAGPVKESWGYTYRLPDNMLFHNAVNLWGFGLSLAAFIVCLRFSRRVIEKNKKIQSKFMCAGIGITVFAGGLSHAILPFLGIRIPGLATVSFAFLCVLVSYAVWKHGLFSMSPFEAADKIIATMADPLLMISAGGRVLNANRALFEKTEYTGEEIIGQEADLVLQGGFPSNIRYKEKIKEGFIKNIETELKAKNKKNIPVSLSISAMADSRKELLAFVAVAKDLRELKNLKSKLIQSEKMRAIDRLTVGIAHEINNPVGSILAGVQLVMEELSPESPYYEDMKLIENSAIRCRDIVRRLLEFSKKGKGEMGKTDLNRAVKKVMGLINREVEFKDINIQISLEENLPPVMASGPGMQQVLLNLLLNARDAINGRGEIRVETSKREEKGGLYAVLSVSDTGSGISKEIRKKLFEPYFTTKGGERGTGLGLPVVKSILERYEAKIDVESSQGKGSEFRVVFPAA
ncbi:MAG: ATP-binding protein [Elusimicrobiota bacterium]